MNIEEITRIAELMTANDLTEFVIESPEIKLSLKRNKGGSENLAAGVLAAAPVAATGIPVAAAPLPGAAAGAGSAAAAEAKVKVGSIDSPIVGTFYTCPAPDSPPFVKAGQEVNEDTVVCIVEAMKVMNEIKAEKRGVIRKVLVENMQPVEFGQPLFEIEEN